MSSRPSKSRTTSFLRDEGKQESGDLDGKHWGPEIPVSPYSHGSTASAYLTIVP